MDEYTRLYISIRVDVAVITSSGDTSSDILTVILEVHDEDLFSTSHTTYLTDAMINVLSLLLCRHEFRSSLHTYRHQMEIPCETASVLNQQIKELIARYRHHILGCIAYRITKDQSILM